MAAPTVGAVMADILPYLGVKQSFSQDDVAGKTVVLEDLSGLTSKEADAKLKKMGISFRSVGNGDTVTDQLPGAGKSVPGGSEILLYFGSEAAEEEVKVPDFTGMNRQQASEAAGKLGLYILVSGNTSLDPKVTAVAQSVAPNTGVSVGTTIKVEFIDTKVGD